MPEELKSKEEVDLLTKLFSLLYNRLTQSTGLVVYKPWAICIILVSSYYLPEYA